MILNKPRPLERPIQVRSSIVKLPKLPETLVSLFFADNNKQ